MKRNIRTTIEVGAIIVWVMITGTAAVLTVDMFIRRFFA